MYESTNNPTEFDRGYAEAERKLRPEIEQAQSRAESYRDAYQRLQDNVDGVESRIKADLEGTMDGELKTFMVEILGLLGCTTTKFIDVTITATWTGTAEVPLDFDESSADLSADMPRHTWPEVMVDYEEVEAEFTDPDVDIEFS